MSASTVCDLTLLLILACDLTMPSACCFGTFGTYIDPGLALTLVWFLILHLCCLADTYSCLPDHLRFCICLL